MILLKFILLEVGGFFLIKYAKWLVDSTQRLDFAEKWFGPTGTYTFWKLIGVAFIIYGFVVLMK